MAAKKKKKTAGKNLVKKKKQVKKKFVKKKPAKKKKSFKVATARSVSKLSKKSDKKDANLKSELEKLKKELGKFKKKPKAKRMVNEYNLFIRKRILAGSTFIRAVSEWKKFKKLQNKRKPSAYNSFMASQLKQGKSFKEAVALWKRLKSGKLPKKKKPKKAKKSARRKPKKKPRAGISRPKSKALKKSKKKMPRRKPVKKPVKKRPGPKKKARKKTKKKKAQGLRYRTRIVQKQADLSGLEKILEKALGSKSEKTTVTTVTKEDLGLPPEELAYKMVMLYFEELARIGLKRSVSLEELVRVYMHSLERVGRRIGSPKKTLLSEEEMAYRLVKLYFSELARFGVRRTMNFDELLDAYFFVLGKIYPRAVVTKTVSENPEKTVTTIRTETTESQ